MEDNSKGQVRRTIGITETLFRDAHQSLLATRLKTEDMLAVAELIDNIGFHSLEVWGGATFDTSLRFLNEDPWERLRLLRKTIKKTKLQMLLRGQNLVGYRQQPDDVVDLFVQKAVENGIDIIRIFDALNDTRNLERAISATKKAGAHAQGTIVYTVSPVHSVEGYVQMAIELQHLGCDSIAIKDMAGLLKPAAAEVLVAAIKERVPLPLQLHCHYTSGLASMTYWCGIQSGADVVDTALSPLALGTSQPPSESMVAALSDTEYSTGIDLAALTLVTEKMENVLQGYRRPKIAIDTEVLISQIPGGMLSNLVAQLEQQKMGHKYKEIIKEVPRVRKDLGYPPLVTPMSQIVGVQALFNVITGRRYEVKSKEINDYLGGYYGRPPGTIEPELKQGLAKEPITGRPADRLAPALEEARREIADQMQQEEDILTYLMFPEPARKFFASRK